MADWDAQQYLKFEDERTRAARDLLAQIPVQDARGVVDIGCGPGNSTELLARRWPQAKITGIDTSADMLRQARERLPQQTFIEANISHWAPPGRHGRAVRQRDLSVGSEPPQAVDASCHGAAGRRIDGRSDAGQYG